jgi:diguanylate cyclase (GGDEF)-like protein
VKQPLFASWRRLRDGRYWLYALAAVPFFTELIETHGALPSTALGWTTEVVVGLVVALLAHKVRRDYRALASLARSDALTGLQNRRAFDEALAAECARSRRHGAVLTLLFLDLDGFKRINDVFGHATGDRVLQLVGQAIRSEARSHVDGGYRFGGDEFAVLLPDTTAFEAVAVVARIRARCAAGVPDARALRVSVSVGVAEFAPPGSPQELMDNADAAMYAQKRARGDLMPHVSVWRPMARQGKC